jgi:hypothetical protein
MRDFYAAEKYEWWELLSLLSSFPSLATENQKISPRYRALEKNI